MLFSRERAQGGGAAPVRAPPALARASSRFAIGCPPGDVLRGGKALRDGPAAMSAGGTLSILRSDSYADLSQYRDQHFRVSGVPPLLLVTGAARFAWAVSGPRPGCGPAVRVTLSLRLRGRDTTRSGC